MNINTKVVLVLITIVFIIFIVIRMNSIQKMTTFNGTAYRLASNWEPYIPADLKDKPIKYLEIGAFHGANVISVANLFGQHKDSKLYCIDPWTNYDDYLEYKEDNTQQNNYNLFMNNIKNYNLTDKIVVLRGFSNKELPKLEDNSFDMIYIDGNHEPEYVLEDAVLSFRKLKVGGYLIFDDYEWYNSAVAGTHNGINAFFDSYYKRIKELNRNHNGQSFLQKIK